MIDNTLFQVRVTGVLIETGKILLVKQKVSECRHWSLPGGRLEMGETLAEGIKREMLEETGLAVEVTKLLYLCEKPDISPPLLHITFLLQRTNGHIKLPSNEFDSNPIEDVRFIAIEQLCEYGFSNLFIKLAQQGFPDSGDYKGSKATIGL